jgi:hypothetical protein
VELMNKHLVTAHQGKVLVGLPPRAPMTSDEAIELAAWLVAMAGIVDAGKNVPCPVERLENAYNDVLST